MVRIMAAFLGFCGLAFLLLSCGADSAIPGATVVGPDDTTVTYVDSLGGVAMTAAPLEFQVLAPDGKTPVPNVHISFFAGGQVGALTDRSGITALNPSDPASFETNTDDRGLSPKDVYAVWAVPPCRGDASDATKAGPDLSLTGTVEASIGTASKLWTVNITVKGDGTNHGCLP